MAEQETESENDRVPLLRERPIVNYTKRYDQVSWHSADTDFESAFSNPNEIGRKKRQKKIGTSSRRKQKLAALIIVVAVFLGVMGGLIYLYVARGGDYIDTECGKISGISKTISYDSQEKDIYMYRGIPYALPPVNKLRWKAPEIVPNGYCGGDIFKADSYKRSCEDLHEDCLYLNVFTPSTPEVTDEKKPVFVVMSDNYNGDVSSSLKDLEGGFSASMDAVVVTVQYRVGVFGFLALEQLENVTKFHGNFGMQDQILALRWVKKNIELFGGDKDSVTLLGGTSIFYLVASKHVNQNINFHRAIAMSGSPNLNNTYKEASLYNQKFLNQSRCFQLIGTSLLKCLQSLTTTEVQEIFDYSFSMRWDFPEYGIFEQGLLAKATENDVPTKSIPLILGNTGQETGRKSRVSFRRKTLSDLKVFLNGRLGQFSTKNLTKVVFDQLYTNMMGSLPEYLYETITSDVRVICPTNQLKKFLESSQKHLVYRYVFEWALEGSDTYAYNGLDLLSLFTTDSSNSYYEPGKILRENFKHFIRYDHPLHSGWGTDKTAIVTNNTDVAILNGDFHEKQCSFWNNPENGFLPYVWKN